MINNKLYLIAQPNEPVTIIWGSANATIAYNNLGSIGFTGQQVVTPTKTTAYTYTFAAGSAQTTCTVTAVVLTGTTGQGTGPVAVAPAQQTSVTSTSAATPVTVTTSPATASTTPSTASFSASEIPLLAGGVATPGAVVPVQYLQLINTSSTQTTLPGVWLKQDGSAPLSSIIGFTTVDDKAQFRTSVGGTEGAALFKNGLAFVPLNAAFAPGQLRIFTIKAQVSHNLLTSTGSAYGTTLMLDTASISTTGAVNARFPIVGTTWTLQATN